MAVVRGGITVKPHVQRCADALVEEFGSGLAPGTYHGHSPPEGPTQALDLFNPETQAGWDLQRRVADWLIKNQKKYGVRYVIKWNPNGADWIWNIERAGEGWRAMATRDHRNHVHVTFYAKAAEVVDPPKPKPKKESDGMFRYWAMDGSQRFCNHIYRSWQGLDPLDAEAADEVGEAPLKDKLSEKTRKQLDTLPNFPNPGV